MIGLVANGNKIDYLFSYFIFIKEQNKIKTKLQIMETTCECAICYESMENGLQKWRCGHLFHQSCLDKWGHSCPLCRNSELLVKEETEEITWSISRNPTNVLDIDTMKYSHQQVPTEKCHMYRQLWKDRDCVLREHTMHYFQGRCVTTICETCNTVENFPLQHE